uniref:Cation-transporting atpase 13a3 n=1 Tax=Triatoma infestans TaxID=30076 RepID=A0A170WZA9_TRIIF
MKIMKRFLQVV